MGIALSLIGDIRQVMSLAPEPQSIPMENNSPRLVDL